MASHHPGATTAPDPHLAPPILATWLSVFRPCFTAPVWNRILVLVAGAVLAPGKRTVTQVLRVMGLADEPSFRRYHEVLSRARWDGQAVARVLFNTNCTLIQPKRFQELIDTGLDELRVSLDAADRGSYAKIRGKDFFNRIVRDVGKFVAHQKQVGATKPRVSLWLTGLKETIDQLPEFVRLAAQMGVTEVHLQRLVFDEIGYGKATAGNSLFESAQEAERRAIEAAQEIALPLEVTLAASGATEPELSLKRQDKRAWAACRRPWSLMYFTAHGRALPCCIAALLHARLQQLHARRRDAAGIAGNLEQRRLSRFPHRPPVRRATGALSELRDAMEPLSLVIPNRWRGQRDAYW